MPDFPMAVNLEVIPPPQYVDSPDQAHRIGEVLRRECGVVGFDSETMGVDNKKKSATDIRSAEIVFCSLGTHNERWVFPRWALPGLETVLGDPNVAKCGSNLYGLDYFACKNSGVPMRGTVYDTLVMDDLLDERKPHGLKDCQKRYFDHGNTYGEPERSPSPDYKTLFGSTKIWEIDEHHPKFIDMVDYASRDAWEHWQLYRFLSEQLDKVPLWPGQSDRTMLDHFLEVEAPFTNVLIKIMERGIRVDTGYLDTITPGIEKRLKDLEKAFAKEAGVAINIRSTAQLTKLFTDKGYTPLKLTDTNAMSVDTSVLEAWAGDGCPLSPILLEHRKLTKFLGTSVKGLLKWTDENNRVHTTLKQHRASTGRLSSADPNLQNVPRPDKDEFKIRGAFVGGPGKELICADWSQVEMRIMAALSGDEVMLGAIGKGLDLHCYTVSLVVGVPYEEVIEAIEAVKTGSYTNKQAHLKNSRSALKAVGFGILYGKQKWSLAEEQNISVTEAGELINTYLSSYPRVLAFIKKCHRQIEKTGKNGAPDFAVQTYLGRYRRLDNPKMVGKGDGLRARRQAQNTPIQGTASDIMKCAMIRAEHDPILKELGAEQILTVHDEILLEADKDPELLNFASRRLEELMGDPFEGVFDARPKLPVALPADAHWGPSWLEAKG